MTRRGGVSVAREPNGDRGTRCSDSRRSPCAAPPSRARSPLGAALASRPPAAVRPSLTRGPARHPLHLNASVHHRRPGRHRLDLRSLGRGCWTSKGASATAAGRRSNGSAPAPSGSGSPSVARLLAPTGSSTGIASGRARQTPALERRPVATFAGSRDRPRWSCAPRSSGARHRGWLHSRSMSGSPAKSRRAADHPRDRRCWRDLHGRPGCDRCRRC